MAEEYDYDENDALDGSMTDMWVPKMSSCTCCKGYIYGCSGGLCKSLGVCECSAAEEFEKEEQEAAQKAAAPAFELQRGVVNAGGGGGSRYSQGTAQSHHHPYPHHQQQGGRGAGGGRGRGGGGRGSRGNPPAAPDMVSPELEAGMHAMMQALLQQATGGGTPLVLPAPGGLGMVPPVHGPYGASPPLSVPLAMPMGGGMMPVAMPMGRPVTVVPSGGVPMYFLDTAVAAPSGGPVAYGAPVPLMPPLPGGGPESAWQTISARAPAAAQGQGQGSAPPHLRSNASEFVPSTAGAGGSAAAAAGVWASEGGTPGISLSTLGITAPLPSAASSIHTAGTGGAQSGLGSVTGPAGAAFLLPKGLTDTPVPTPPAAPTSAPAPAWSQRGKGAPAAPAPAPGPGPVPVPAQGGATAAKAQAGKKADPSVEAVREAGEKQGAKKDVASLPPPPAAAVPVAPPSSSQAALLAAGVITDPEEAKLRKEIHKREKKVRDCEELEKRQAGGETLDETQRIKLGNKAAFERDLGEASAKLEQYLASRPSPTPATSGAAAPAPAPAPVLVPRPVGAAAGPGAKAQPQAAATTNGKRK